MFRPLVIAAALVSLGACAPDGPPIQVAASAVDLEPETEAALIDRAPILTGDASDVPPGPTVVGPDPTAPSGDAEAPTDASGRPAMPSAAVVIGDSIALSAQPLVTAALESFGIDLVAYDAMQSRRMVAGSSDLPSGSTAIRSVLVDGGATVPLWIVALGTNDVGAQSNADTVRADIDHVLNLIPDDAHLLWVDTWVRDLDELALSLNAQVRERLADRPNSWVLDWHSHADTDGLIGDDGVHLTQRGQVEYARMIGDAIRATYERD